VGICRMMHLGRMLLMILLMYILRMLIRFLLLRLPVVSSSMSKSEARRVNAEKAMEKVRVEGSTHFLKLYPPD